MIRRRGQTRRPCQPRSNVLVGGLRAPTRSPPSSGAAASLPPPFDTAATVPSGASS